jgi:N6-adenosine-specific RNA methylase IME4
MTLKPVVIRGSYSPSFLRSPYAESQESLDAPIHAVGVNRSGESEHACRGAGFPLRADESSGRNDGNDPRPLRLRYAAGAPVRYATIVADPPWSYPSPGAHLRASVEHRPNSHDQGLVGSKDRYGRMAIADICALRPPVEDNAHLYLWTTNAFMVEAHAISEAWGFRQITILTYGKVQPNGLPSARTGHYFRGATEHCLFCVRGSLPLSTAAVLPTLWLWPRLPHSVKPDAFYDLVEQASPGPYLEMFARRQRLGWHVWGDEVDSHVPFASRGDA